MGEIAHLIPRFCLFPRLPCFPSTSQVTFLWHGNYQPLQWESQYWCAPWCPACPFVDQRLTLDS